MPETGTSPRKIAPRPLYAHTIHQCAGTGDLAEMKALVNEAEQHLREHGDVSAALEALKAEIAKLEAR
jgi:HPt (histidine-containing phosphotransfer) domain-containing protein